MNTTKSVSLLFYKGRGTLAEKIIRLWTKSPFSHSEFLRSDGFCHSNDRFRFVSRIEILEIDPADWERVDITLPHEIVDRIERRQLRKNGTSYDWIGILFSQVFRLGIHDKRRWFCSKSNADDLMYAHKLMKRSRRVQYDFFLNVLEPIYCFMPNEFAPSDLFRIVRMMEQIQGQFAVNMSGDRMR